MPETLQKLRPDRDLQCYFLHPSAIAAISQSSAAGFVVSGTWRQQFDWAVVEWNRDNTFEHPFLRNLPDGDLSGLVLTYEETRENCIPLDSNLFHTVDWPTLRVWAEGQLEPSFVPLKDHATAIEGGYVPASAVFTLQGTPTVNDYVEVAWLSEHYTYQFVSGSQTLADSVQAIVDAINAGSPVMAASRTGNDLTLTYLGESATPGVRETAENSKTGANGNRLGAYANVGGAATESWSPGWQTFSGGASPVKWRITLNFASITYYDQSGAAVSNPSAAVRKMRWTYAADFQTAAYQRGEFQMAISNWSVTGTGLNYQVAGKQSRRVEDDCRDLVYSGASGAWNFSRGNFSGGSIHYTTANGSAVAYTYTAAQNHRLYLGTRKADAGAQISIVVDNQAAWTEDLSIPGEDVLVRLSLGDLAGGVSHTVTVTHSGSAGAYFYFDFFEIAVLSQNLPAFAPDSKLTLATDWDTDHSIALAPERTAWLIHTLGFSGRANHYVGALWFYELVRQGHSYASGTVTFTGTPSFSAITEVSIVLSGTTTTLQHLNLIADTPDSIAKAFELVINNGFTGICALAAGPVLTIYARAMGAAGNQIGLSASPASGAFLATASGSFFSGGQDGNWRTDLIAAPRINRAARDWCRSYYAALTSYGVDVAAAFSMELQHGDPDPAAGIAQRYNDGAAVQLTTPALQTNFSPISIAFWKQVYLDMADVMVAAGCVPYLQFGEVQWWYFPWDQNPNAPHSSLPLYDSYTTSTFSAEFGRPMHVFADSSESPASFPDEAQFLPGLIWAFTSPIMSFVRQTHANTRFEVLYPPDVNNSPLNEVINLPAQWTSANLDCFKTENFTFTGLRDMNAARESILTPMQRGFPASKASHLVGIGDYTTPWLREVRAAKAEGVESVVLFALDQFCLIGYPAPLDRSSRRSAFMAQ
jgi:hypothetical protein